MKRKDFLKSVGFLSTLPLVSCANILNSASKTQSNIIKPKRLKKGDKVGLIAPGSYITEDQLKESVDNLESIGLKPFYTDTILKKYGYLAGTDKERAEDINRMFADKSIKGIFAARGGYGCSRILPLLDYKTIKKNPKILIGYSDITALLYGIFSQTGLITFHGPVGISTFNEYSNKHVKNILFEPKPNYTMMNLPEDESKINIINKGVAKGKLVGGNSSIVVTMIGTKYDVDLKDKIVFLEDVGEEPYRIDRMLTHLLEATNIKQAAGIALGVFNNCEIDKDDPEFENSLTLDEVFKDRLGNLNIPVISGLSFGHISNKFTLPFGIEAKLDTNKKSLTLQEPAVEV